MKIQSCLVMCSCFRILIEHHNVLAIHHHEHNWHALGLCSWKNITAQLKAVGMTLDNIVKITTIVTSLYYLPAVRASRAEAMGGRRRRAGWAGWDWLVRTSSAVAAEVVARRISAVS